MKTNLSIVLFLTSLSFLYGQDLHLDVAGHAKIIGNIEIHHPDDNTSLFIGKNAGIMSDFSGGNKFNAFFGVDAGAGNTSGAINSFFGGRAGSNNTTGQSNTFFGSLTGGSNMSGSENTFIGVAAGSKSSNGTRNTFLGFGADMVNAEAMD